MAQFYDVPIIWKNKTTTAGRGMETMQLGSAYAAKCCLARMRIYTKYRLASVIESFELYEASVHNSSPKFSKTRFSAP
jgi:hypothetical protein